MTILRTLLVLLALATTAAFAQTVRYLQPHFNVVLFDEPYAGQSKQYNSNRRPITKEQEASILLELIDLLDIFHQDIFERNLRSATGS